MNPVDCNAKQIGSYYTPSWLARWISDRALAEWYNENGKQEKMLLNRVKAIKIVDPASGDGAFLAATGDALLLMRKQLGDFASDKEIKMEIVNDSLYGVDIVKRAVNECRTNLQKWADSNAKPNVEQGNSISGDFDWTNVFDDVFERENPGFDIALGNPPYGNILPEEEKAKVKQSLTHDVSTGRKGTWNTAALFIVRAWELLRRDGYLGFLVPNSILRVGQFSKLREFILDKFTVTTVVDEGNPFEGVTLEMVSILARSSRILGAKSFLSMSRRPGFSGTREVPLDLCQSSRVIPLYYDDIFKRVIIRGKRGILHASRGRDMPKRHVSPVPTNRFEIPYATSGKSIKRYRLDERFFVYVDDWFKDDTIMAESYNNEMLLATKNYPYPRCVMKPKGVIHGGGAVRIAASEDLDMKAVGLILNSRFIRYLCIRYLTNYSQLTTCLNTGIMEDLPLVMPTNTSVFADLFDLLSALNAKQGQSTSNKELMYHESVADALVYELYLTNSEDLLELTDDVLGSPRGKSSLYTLIHPDIEKRILEVFSIPEIKKIESSPRM